MMTILFFLIALGILIFVHEFGHFIVAKRQGIKVEAFSFGFGPRLIGIKRGETDYRISALPFGGYVKMLGEDPTDSEADSPRSFSKKTVWQRAKVLLWGPLMNFLLCLILMPIVFMIGRPQPAYLDQPPAVIGVRAESPAEKAGLEKGDVVVAMNGTEVSAWEPLLNRIIITSPGSTATLTVDRDGAQRAFDVTVGEMPEMQGGYLGIEPILFIGNEATIDDLAPGGPAEKAGLKKGDRVMSFGGRAVTDWLDLTTKVGENGGKKAEIVVDREGARQTLSIVPEYNESFDRWLIGIRKDRRSGVPMEVKRYGFFGAIVKGTQENLKLVKLTFNVLGRLVTFRLSYKVLGGPVIIAKTSAAAAASGFAPFIFFLAFLSMQLAILNLLPIPVLDGGHLMFLGFEVIMRRPVSLRVREIATQVGFFALISFMLLITINDIEHVWGIRALLGKIF